MNAEGTKITGMIAVCSGPRGDCRLSYEIDLATGKVWFDLNTRYAKGADVKYPVGSLEGSIRLERYASARKYYEAARAACEESGVAE